MNKKVATYTAKNPQTDSETLGSSDFLPNFIVTTALGCISFVISLEPCLISIKALITFIPPPVEPAHAPDHTPQDEFPN